MRYRWIPALLSVLLCVLCLRSGARAEAEMVSCRCDEGRFSIRIPAGFSVSACSFTDSEYDVAIGTGVAISPEGKDQPFQVRVVRKDYPFNNPGLYLTTEFYQYLYAQEIYDFGSDTAYCSMGGRTLFSTLCSYTDHDEKTIREFRLIEPGSDTEFMARYSAEDEEAALALLDTVIRYMQPDAVPEPKEAKIRPVSSDPDLMNGTFRLKVEDTGRIASEGYFTAALYEKAVYSAADVYAMQPGDTIQINDRVFTITDIDPWELDDGTWYEVSLSVEEACPDQEYSGFCLEQADDGFVMYFGNDNYASRRIGSVPVHLPLPETFEYYDVPGGDDPELKPTDRLLEDLQSSFAMIYLNQYNTTCEIRDGRLVRIDSWSYPFGPVDSFIP